MHWHRISCRYQRTSFTLFIELLSRNQQRRDHEHNCKPWIAAVIRVFLFPVEDCTSTPTINCWLMVGCTSFYVDGLDFITEGKAIEKFTSATKWPFSHGIFVDWRMIERFMEQEIFTYLKAELEINSFLVTSTKNSTRQRTYCLTLEPFYFLGVYLAI